MAPLGPPASSRRVRARLKIQTELSSSSSCSSSSSVFLTFRGRGRGGQCVSRFFKQALRFPTKSGKINAETQRTQRGAEIFQQMFTLRFSAFSASRRFAPLDQPPETHGLFSTAWLQLSQPLAGWKPAVPVTAQPALAKKLFPCKLAASWLEKLSSRKI